MILINGLLYLTSDSESKRSTQSREYNQLVVPEAYVPTLLKLLHNSRFGAHVGERKCVTNGPKKVIFPQDATKELVSITAYDTCARFKGHMHNKASIHHDDTSTLTLRKVAMTW